MANLCFYISNIIAAYLSLVILTHQSSAITDSSEVAVIQDLYKSLNQPRQLTGWNLMEVADPCEETWRGISCAGSSIISIHMNGLELHGSLGGNLGDLLNLKQLNVSNNHIEGEIPSSLPPNVTHMDLSSNELTGDLPSSFKKLTKLNELFLQRNYFTGSLDVLIRLPLRVLHIQLNSFSGVPPDQIINIPNLRIEVNDFYDPFVPILGPGDPTLHHR